MKHSVQNDVRPVAGAQFTRGQQARIDAHGFTHYAKLNTGSRDFGRVPRYFLDQCDAAGFSRVEQIGGTTGGFIVLGLKK